MVCPGIGQELMDKTSRHPSTGGFVVRIQYRPPDPAVDMASHSQVLLPMGDFNHPNTC